jgi:hypothetical protein
VAQWTPEDFRSAWRDDDAMLAEAVNHLGQKSVGDARVVPLLVELLTVEEGPEAQSGPRIVPEDERSVPNDIDILDNPSSRGDIQASDSVVRAVIEALAKNNTHAGYTALQNLLLGQLKAPLPPRELVSEVVRALASNINAESENTLFVLLSKPEEITSRLAPPESETDRGGPWRRGRGRYDELDPDWLQQEVLNEAGPATSSQFRIRLAQFLKDPNVLVETANAFEEFLVGSDPRNTAAQVILYQIPHTQERTIEQIEQTLTESSRQALRQLLGVTASTSSRGDQFDDRPARRPSGAVRPQRPSRQTSSRRDEYDDQLDLPRQTPVPTAPQTSDYFEMVQLLWKPEVVEALPVNLPAAGDDRFGNQSRVPLLLATIPLESARAKLGGLLEQRVDDGPELWTSVGLFRDELVDPALLVLTKEAYQKRSTTSRANRARTGTSRLDDTDPGRDAGDWESTIETLVRDLCAQLQSAGRGSSTTDDSAGGTPPVRMHRNANVVAELHVRWPDQLDQRWASLPIAPLDLYYVRAEEEGRPRSNLSIYTRQLSRAERHELSGGGLWLDDFNRKQRRSIDVRVTGEGGDLGLNSSARDRNSRANQSVPYVIEVLSVAIAKPDEETPTAEAPDAPARR